MKNLLIKATYTSAFFLLAAPSALASISDGANDAQPTGTPTNLSVSFRSISDTLIYLVGAVAVIVLIVGGLRYVISQGEAASVKQAKDTLLYGIIGLVLAVLAYAIVNFVTTSIK
jgi:type IV secretion system pilin